MRKKKNKIKFAYVVRQTYGSHRLAAQRSRTGRQPVIDRHVGLSSCEIIQLRVPLEKWCEQADDIVAFRTYLLHPLHVCQLTINIGQVPGDDTRSNVKTVHRFPVAEPVTDQL